MNWIVVKKFPLSTDLSHITGFLCERAIEHSIYEESGQQVIAVADPRMVAPIAQFLEEVAQGKLIISQEEKSPATVENSAAPVAPSYVDQISATPVTSLFILLSAIGGLLVAFDTSRTFVGWFTFQKLFQHYFLPLHESLNVGEVWRLVTPAFLHFGILHFVFNSLWLWDLGRRTELLIGQKNYILFFLITSAISNIAQYRWAADTLFGGMSGVVYALVGYIFVSHRLAPNPLSAVPASVIGFMLFWLVLCMTGVVDFLAGGGIANAAHVGGLLAGAAYAALTVKRTPPQV